MKGQGHVLPLDFLVMSFGFSHYAGLGSVVTPSLSSNLRTLASWFPSDQKAHSALS